MNTIASLKKKMMEQVRESLNSDVTTTVQAIQRQEIKRKVYNVYKPSYYTRRYQDGGLLSRDNIVGETSNTGNGVRLTVSNITEFNRSEDSYRWTFNSGGGDYLTPLIVLGNDRHRGSGYTYQTMGAEYMNPRDFITSTKEALITTQAHTKSLRHSLSQKGLSVD